MLLGIGFGTGADGRNIGDISHELGRGGGTGVPLQDCCLDMGEGLMCLFALTAE
jgi:hypothetical protein